jgi:hypothetical protein
MSWRPWPKTETGGLARYVLPSAATDLLVPAQPAELPNQPESRRALVEAIYAALVSRGITYRLEDYHPDLDRQRIRPPGQVLDVPRIGTCLDLAVTFCGICLGHNLLPLLIVLGDHAFAAVSLSHTRAESQSRTRKERALFDNGVLHADRVGDLRTLLDEHDGGFLPVECTGFARAASLSASRPEGRNRERDYLSFPSAVAAAREHLDAGGRRLLFAIDVATLHDAGYVPPPPMGDVEALADVRVYAGATALRLDYPREVAHILQYYRARFVNRDAEQNAVFDFVRGLGPLGRASYLLIEGRGGFGKSAFMVHLVAHAQDGTWAGPPPYVVFFFVRRQGRQDTPEAFLQAVNGQLLTHLGASGGMPTTLPELRAQFTQLWTAVEASAGPEAPLLLLVDGLDAMSTSNAGDVTLADVLPSPSNPAIRVVVSSRPQPRASERVGREHPLAAAGVLPLGAFDLASVERLLASLSALDEQPRRFDMTAVPASEVKALATRIVSLTGGEPLFARFVCDALVRGGVETLQQLEKSPPRDAEDYFRRELAAIRGSGEGEESWQILGVLCVVRSRLAIDDLAGILQQPPRRIRQRVEGLRRFFLGDERFELMHSRLRDLLVSEFTRAELQGFADRVIAWCGEYRTGGWPADTPVYVLENFLGHLAERGQIEAACDALDRAWFLRRRENARGEGAFVADMNYLLGYVERLRSDSSPAGASNLDMARLQLAFLMTSVAGRFYWLGPEYIEAQALCGTTNAAYYLCSAIQSAAERGDALLRYLHIRPNDDIKAEHVLADAFVAAAAHAKAAKDVGLLVRVADEAAAFGADHLVQQSLDEAAVAAASFPATTRAKALAALAGAWGRRQRMNVADEYATKALAAAASVASNQMRHVELMWTASVFARAGLPEWSRRAVVDADAAMPRQELAQGFAVLSVALAALTTALTDHADAAALAIAEAVDTIGEMEEGYLSVVDDQPINTTNRKARVLPIIAEACLASGRAGQAPAVADEMKDAAKQPEVRAAIAGLLAEAGELTAIGPLLEGIDDIETRSLLAAVAAAAAAAKGEIEAAERLLESTKPSPVMRVAFYSAAAVWLKKQGTASADSYYDRATRWASQVASYEPNRVLRTKVRCLVRIADELAAKGRSDAGQRVRDAATRAAEAARETFHPVVMAELVPDRSSPYADEAPPIFVRVQTALEEIADTEQRKAADGFIKQTYADRGWYEQLPAGTLESASRIVEASIARDRRSEALQHAVKQLIESGTPPGRPRSLAVWVDDVLETIGPIRLRTSDSALTWYRELARQLVSMNRVRAASQLVSAFTAEPAQYVLTHSILDAMDDASAWSDDGWLDHVLSLGFPHAATLSWVVDRAVERKAWAAAATAAARLLSLARTTPIGCEAASVCGRALASMAQTPRGEAVAFADASDGRCFRLAVEGGGAAVMDIHSDAEIAAAALLFAGKGDFVMAATLLGSLPDQSPEWDRARAVFAIASRRGALDTCLSHLSKMHAGRNASYTFSPDKHAAAALAEAGLADEAIALADSVLGEWVRPGLFSDIGFTFLWMDKLDAALRVAALAESGGLLQAVGACAAELGRPDIVAAAIERTDHPTFRLSLHGSYGRAIRNHRRAGAPPSLAWMLPPFVVNRADWFGHVTAIAPEIVDRLGSDCLEAVATFVLRTDDWLTQV